MFDSAFRLSWRTVIRSSVWPLLAASALAGTELDANRVNEIAAWLPPKPSGFGRTIADRTAWKKLASLPAFAEVVTSAEKLAKQGMPALPDGLFLDFSRTGNRDRCQKVLAAREGRVVTFALAECLENRGHFIGPLTDTIAALCQERTWVYPAHDRKLDNFHGKSKEMDLRATALGWELATADYLLGDKLPAATRHLVHQQVEDRVLQPFREMVEGRRPQVYWLHATHNWNAVCLAGVTGAALALEESPQDRAWYIAAAEHYIRFFLSGFTPDGYCSEGVGYWGYGFGRFLMLGESIRQATDGRLDLLADPAALQPALFCTRDEIINGVYPTIADCHPGSRPEPLLVRFIYERFRLVLPANYDVVFQRPAGNLASTAMFAFLPNPLPAAAHAAVVPDSPLRTWFKDGGVLLCRPAPGAPALAGFDAGQTTVRPQNIPTPKPAETGAPGGSVPFAAALKGGNNAEHHNHNDVGSFSVVVGRAMVICDPGSEVYTARTFGAHRYDSKVLNSFGHAVPVVAGQLQRTGADARAVVKRAEFSDEADTLELDITSAYPAPELKQLERTFVFHRTGPASLTIKDEVAFSAPKSFETALITWGRWEKVSEKELLVTDGDGAVRVRIETGGRPFQISAEKIDEDVPAHRQPLRLGIALKAPVRAATVTLTITPATPAAKTKH